MENVIRVLVVGYTQNPGGLENFIMNFYRNIDRNKIKFDFLVEVESIAYEDEIKKYGGKIYHITPRRKNPIAYYKELKNFFKNNKDHSILHVNLCCLSGIAPIIFAKKYSNIKTIAHSHMDNFIMPKNITKLLHNFNKNRIGKYTDLFLACSNKAGEWMFGENNEFIVLNNSINAQKYVFNDDVRNKVRTSLNINNKFVIGNVARFEYPKNHRFIIDIFYEIYIKDKNAILMLVGTGGLKEDIVQYVKDKGISDNVLFLGARNDINELMQSMDVFILPSLSEGLPIVSIEAQTAGLKCILSENITNELNITGNVEFISLSKDENYWAKEILKYKDGYNRENKYMDICNNRYDIKIESKSLEHMYIDIHNS